MSNVARVAGQAANTLSKPLNVEDVFSTYLYEGNWDGGAATTNQIVNGIDLSTEGGLVWIKNRGQSNLTHRLFDSETSSGVTGFYNLSSASTAAAGGPNTSMMSSFNSDGFTVGNNADVNSSYHAVTDYASWTFRKAPKFFDVVTYTGNGTNQTISHNLDAEVGCIMVKATSAASHWAVWHNSFSVPTTNYLRLNSTNAKSSDANYWNSTAPTSSAFSVGASATTNSNGVSYVAYLFAHNDGDGEFGPDGDADIIKCGSVTYTTGATVDLGFEPQWVLVKPSSSTGNWILNDVMRGMPNGSRGPRLDADTSGAEIANATVVYPTSTGFIMPSGLYTNPTDLIYIAIRRGPMAVPESADEVFAIDTKNSSGDNTDPTWDLGIVTDMAIQKFNKTTSTTPLITSRLTGTQYLKTSETDAETSNSGMNYDHMTGVGTGNGSTTDVNDIVWGWKRAPNYFDVVAYTGDGTNGRAISHNLGVAPEMMWVRVRNAANDWVVYHKDLGEDTILRLNSTSATISKNVFSSNTPTDSVFYVQGSAGYDVNYSSSQTYIAYLFASLDGVSKVGSFTTTGSDVNVDCGFSAGPRFVLIKNTASGNWFVMDTERGITSGTDPFLTLNTTNAESSALDLIDINPTSTGFTVNQGSFGNGTFIFYAIA